MAEPVGDVVTVPDVTGLPFGLACSVAEANGVALANTDPDGPPIGAIAWQREVRIGTQDPPGGTAVTRWASVRVELVADGDDGATPVGVEAPRIPPADAAYATADPEPTIVELGSDEQL